MKVQNLKTPGYRGFQMLKVNDVKALNASQDSQPFQVPTVRKEKIDEF